MSARAWRVSVFCLLFVTAFLNGAVLLFLLGLFAGADWFVLIPIFGSLLLFATSGVVLLWPRFGSTVACLSLVGIASWLVIPVSSGITQHDRKTVAFFSVLLVLVALGLWFTSREALGFTRHVPPDEDSQVYLSISSVFIAFPPVLLVLYCGWLFATGAIRIGP